MIKSENIAITTTQLENGIQESEIDFGTVISSVFIGDNCAINDELSVQVPQDMSAEDFIFWIVSSYNANFNACAVASAGEAPLKLILTGKTTDPFEIMVDYHRESWHPPDVA